MRGMKTAAAMLALSAAIGVPAASASQPKHPHQGAPAKAAYARGEATTSGTLIWFGVGIAVLVIAGVAIFLYGR